MSKPLQFFTDIDEIWGDKGKALTRALEPFDAVERLTVVRQLLKVCEAGARMRIEALSRARTANLDPS